MMKWFFTTLTSLALILFMGSCTNAPHAAFAQSQRTFTVIQNTGNDLAAIQKAIDDATANGGIAYVPAGEYQLDGDLWVASNSILRGDGDATVLRFSKGKIRSLKNSSKSFWYTNNYNNEVIPNDIKTVLSNSAPSGATQFAVDDASQFHPGDWIYSDNNIKDTWTILEDGKRSDLWNDPHTPFARQEIFQITKVQGNTLELDRPLRFPLQKGASVHQQIGARNFEIASLKIINPDEEHPLLFEQPMNARFINLTVEAKGGITLTHEPYNNLIENCHFITNGWRGITVEYFGVKNRIVNNQIDYVTGGDCSLLVMFSCHDNTVAYNNIMHIGKNHSTRDEAGIYIHATSYDNVVHHNVIDGTLEAIGSYYSAFNNVFFDNRGTNVRVGIMSYYARNNSYINNHFQIVPKPPVDAVGALVYGSYGNLFQRNDFKGNFVDGLRILGSHDNDILDNVISGPGDQITSSGIHDIGADKNTGNTFNGADPKSGLRRGNIISDVKYQEE
jgi:parallel beta-helix repeat protein